MLHWLVSKTEGLKQRAFILRPARYANSLFNLELGHCDAVIRNTSSESLTFPKGRVEKRLQELFWKIYPHPDTKKRQVLECCKLRLGGGGKRRMSLALLSWGLHEWEMINKGMEVVSFYWWEVDRPFMLVKCSGTWITRFNHHQGCLLAALKGQKAGHSAWWLPLRRPLRSSSVICLETILTPNTIYF